MPIYLSLNKHSIQLDGQTIYEDVEDELDYEETDKIEQIKKALFATSNLPPEKAKESIASILRSIDASIEKVGKLSYNGMRERIIERGEPAVISLILNGELLIDNNSFEQLKKDWSLHGLETKPPVSNTYTIKDPEGNIEDKTVVVPYFLNWQDLLKSVSPYPPKDIIDDEEKYERWKDRNGRIRKFLEIYPYNKILKRPQWRVDDIGQRIVKFSDWSPSDDDIGETIKNVPIENDDGTIELQDKTPWKASDFNRYMFAKLKRYVPQAKKPEVFGGWKYKVESGGIKDLNERYKTIAPVVVEDKEFEVLDELDSLFSSIPQDWVETLFGPGYENVEVYADQNASHFDRYEGLHSTEDKAALHRLRRLQAAMLSRESIVSGKEGDKPTFKRYWKRDTIGDSPLQTSPEYGQPYGWFECPACGNAFADIVVLDRAYDSEGNTIDVEPTRPVKCEKCGETIEVEDDFERIESTHREEYEEQMKGIANQIKAIESKSEELRTVYRAIYFDVKIEMNDFWDKLADEVKSSTPRKDEDVENLFIIETSLCGWGTIMNKLDPVRTKLTAKYIGGVGEEPKYGMGIESPYNLSASAKSRDVGRKEEWMISKIKTGSTNVSGIPAASGILGFARDFNTMLSSILKDATGENVYAPILVDRSVGDIECGSILFKKSEEVDIESDEPYEQRYYTKMDDAIDELKSQKRDVTKDAVDNVFKFRSQEALEALKSVVSKKGYEQRNPEVASYIDEKIDELEEYLKKLHGIDDKADLINSQGSDVTIDAVESISGSEREVLAIKGALRQGQNNPDVARKMADIIARYDISELRKEVGPLKRGTVSVMANLADISQYIDGLVEVIKLQDKYVTIDVVQELRKAAIYAISPTVTEPGLAMAKKALGSLRGAYEYTDNDRDVAGGTAEAGELKQDDDSVSNALNIVIDGLADTISMSANKVKRHADVGGIEEKQKDVFESLDQFTPGQLGEMLESDQIDMETVEGYVSYKLDNQGSDVTMDSVNRAKALLSSGSRNKDFLGSVVDAYERGQNDTDVYVELSGLIEAIDDMGVEESLGPADLDDLGEYGEGGEEDWEDDMEWEEELYDED